EPALEERQELEEGHRERVLEVEARRAGVPLVAQEHAGLEGDVRHLLEDRRERLARPPGEEVRDFGRRLGAERASLAEVARGAELGLAGALAEARRHAGDEVPDAEDAVL